MARTIGVKYKNMIKRLVKQELAKDNVALYSVREKVREKMPVEAWDTWECANYEIDRLIDNGVFASMGIG